MKLPGTSRSDDAPTAPAFDPDSSVSTGMKIAGAWGWRILVVVACLAVGGFLIAELKEIVVPFLIALLVSALLQPLVKMLMGHRWPKWLAVVVALLALVVVFGGLVTLVVLQVRSGLPGLEEKAQDSYETVRGILSAPPFSLTEKDYESAYNSVLGYLQDSSKSLLSSVASFGLGAGHFVADSLLTVFAIIFMLIDGDGVWRWVTRLFPRRARPAVDGAGHAGWLTLTTFVRVQIFVAAVDGLGVGLVAFFLGIPLAIPIGVLVFLASFIPVVGAIVSGAFAVLLALLFVGPPQALIMLAGLVGVHLLEAHVLQPLVMGGAVKVHPLAVVFAVAGGSYVAGIPGALFAVPTIAVINVMVSYIASGRWRHGAKPADEAAAADEVVPASE